MTVEHLGTDWETVECDLCGSSQTTGYLRIAPYQFKRDPHYILAKCSSCKLVFLNPRPGPYRSILRFRLLRARGPEQPQAQSQGKAQEPFSGWSRRI